MNAKRRSIDDLLGREPSKPPAEEVAELSLDWADVSRGVSLTWLQFVFERDRNSVKRLLASCKPIRTERNGRDQYYNVAEAAQYLVKPTMEVDKLLGTLKERDLPPDLQVAIWDAKLRKQRFEEKAGNLWHTQDVLDVLGEVFKGLRTTLQLWPDEIAETTELSEKQRKLLTEKIDELQKDLHTSLIENAGKRKTRAQVANHDRPQAAAEPRAGDDDVL